jgi:hypothetical protein
MDWGENDQMQPEPKTVSAELVEARPSVSHDRRNLEAPFDKLRANGLFGWLCEPKNQTSPPAPRANPRCN